MKKLAKWLFGTRTKQLDIPVGSCSSIPKSWYVAEAGQNPLHMLWFVVLVNFDDVASNVKNPRHFVAEECDSFEQALRECVKNCNQRPKPCEDGKYKTKISI